MKSYRGLIVLVSILIILVLLGSAGWIFFPKLLESLEYKVTKSEGPFQIRLYEQYLETKVKTFGSQNDALRTGFIPLARFIGSNNKASKKISMTVPVIQRKGETSENWFVSFSMPSKYTLKTLPKPNQKELIQDQVSEALMAVIKFNGVARKDILDLNEKKLREWVKKIGYLAVGEVQYYFYNDPLTPGVFRRNEVLLEVSKIK